VTKLVQRRYTKCPHCQHPYRIEEIDERNSAAFIERELRKNPSTPRDQEKINRLARLRVKQLKKLQELLQQVYEIQDDEERRRAREEEIAAEETLPQSTPTFGTSRLKRAKTFCGGDSRLVSTQKSLLWGDIDSADLPTTQTTLQLSRERSRTATSRENVAMMGMSSIASESTLPSPFSPLSERSPSSALTPEELDIPQSLNLPPELQKRGASMRLSIKEIEDIEKEIKIVQNENFDDYDLPAFEDLDSNIDGCTPEEQDMFKRLVTSRSRNLSSASNDFIVPLITSFEDIEFESSDGGVVFEPFTPTKADLENMSHYLYETSKKLWASQQHLTPFYSLQW